MLLKLKPAGCLLEETLLHLVGAGFEMQRIQAISSIFLLNLYMGYLSLSTGGYTMLIPPALTLVRKMIFFKLPFYFET